MIYILGAFDRYNYGDLLFPKILSFVFELANISPHVKLLALIDADLTNNGGGCVEALSKYINKFTEKDVLIIAGGEIVGASISVLYFYLKKANVLFFLNKLASKIGLTDFINLFCKLSLGLDLEYPYLLDERKLGCKVIYNAVGGHVFSEKVLQPIQNATYFSTRSLPLYERLISNITKDSTRKKILLFPDSVAVISDYYKINAIRNQVSYANTSALESFGYSYIAFQVSKSYYYENKSVILEQLVKLYTKTKLPIVLVPIGIALRHEDHVACEDIKLSLSVPSYLLNSKTIYDIMYAIANARLFIGTSLHGNITAMSYDIPNVGIGGYKLDDYLKKWGWEMQKVGCISPEDISSFALKVLKQNPYICKDTNMRHKELAYENLKNIVRIVKSS